MPMAAALSILFARAANLVWGNMTAGLVAWLTVCLGILLPNDWTLARAFTKQGAVPAATVAACGFLLTAHRYQVLLTRMNRLVGSVDGGRGLDRNLTFKDPAMRDAYDRWSQTCANQRAIEWLAILAHLAFHLRLMYKPTCNIAHHFLVTVTWSQQLWATSMRHKLTVRCRSFANMALLLWLFTAHTLLIAAGDRCVSNDRAGVQGSIPSAATVSAIFLFIVYAPNPVSMAHSPFALAYGVVASTAVGYLQFLPPSHVARALTTRKISFEAVDPGGWGLLATMLSSCVSAQLAFICHTLITEINLRSFLASIRREN